jgi:hypothetical protein
LVLEAATLEESFLLIVKDVLKIKEQKQTGGCLYKDLHHNRLGLVWVTNKKQKSLPRSFIAAYKCRCNKARELGLTEVQYGWHKIFNADIDVCSQGKLAVLFFKKRSLRVKQASGYEETRMKLDVHQLFFSSLQFSF